jgi:trk system potassium uptake protein TrkA
MQLSEDGHSVVVVDKSRDAFRRLHHFHGKTLVGSGFDRDILFQADARRANALAAVTSGDNTNILCARIARDNYEIKNVVARIYDPARADIYMKLGIPTVATSLWTTQQVKRWLLPADDSIEWTASSGAMHLVERIVPDVLAGKPINSYDHGDGIRVVGVIRGGQGRVNIEGLFAQEDDILEYLVTTEGLEELQGLIKSGLR